MVKARLSDKPFAITTKDLSISYHQTQVIHNINLGIKKQKITILMGPSGSGKTSILRAISTQSSHYQGSIFFDQKNLQQLTPQELLNFRLQTGVLFQKDALFLNLTLYENIALGLRYHFNWPKDLLNEKVHHALLRVNLENYEHYYPEQLSGGMARRAALARALALNPKFLFCDEPFSGQDPINAHNLATLIKNNNQQLTMTTVLVSHEVKISFMIADYIYLFNKGMVVAEGTPGQIKQHPNEFVQSFITMT
ncbi:MAG: ATP-binding cassette domain-containing protein [Pseudomonadota bacterium]|nr:ATP-binding cassette domain-containing protein [Pseudomonadota bacterium]